MFLKVITIKFYMAKFGADDACLLLYAEFGAGDAYLLLYRYSLYQTTMAIDSGVT